MIISLTAAFGTSISIDFRKQLGEAVELQAFHFVSPPIEFRLLRGDLPLQEWQAGNTEVYDLQHGPGVQEWSSRGHRFINDLNHRHDVMTCGVLSKSLIMETRGLGLTFVLLVWPRDTICRRMPGVPEGMIAEVIARS